jgi:hypothetical protein
MPKVRQDGQKSTHVTSKTGKDVARADDGNRVRWTGVDKNGDAARINGTGLNPLDFQEVEADCGSMAAIEGIAPSRTRTLNLVIKSHLLCQLS